MNLATKLFCKTKILTFCVDILTIKNRRYFASFTYSSSNKSHLVKINSVLTLNICNFKREYMDLSSVIKIFEEIVPPNLAESWDNTGLLVEPSDKNRISTILLTNDLTEDVLEEAMCKKSNLIISYHPPIFAPIKSLTQSNWKNCIIVKCIENSIAVYSPHTSCDAVAGGVNDWLINSFDLSESHPIHTSYECHPKYSHIVDFTLSSGKDLSQLLKSLPDSELCSVSDNYGKQNFRVKVNKTSLNDLLKLISSLEGTASVSMTTLSPLPLPSCGMGRIGNLVKPLSLDECIQLVKNYLKLDLIRFAQGASHSFASPISTVAVCAGSGSSVLKGVKADLYITGEMSHHDLLDAIHKNVSVILCEHSNSERGYLKHLAATLKPKLPGVNLIISSLDKDPISII